MYLDKEHTYYINIVSNLNEVWRIDYSQTSNVFGVLRTFQDGSNCGRTFLNFDMDFSVEIGESTSGNCTLSSSGNVVSFERASWGQSFVLDCSGDLSSITFSSASNHNQAATFTLYDGSDCTGTVLNIQSLNSIVVGDNTVNIPNAINLEEGHTYYFNVVSDSDALWQIHYSNTSTGIRIYNRWGDIVYAQSLYENNWDGKNQNGGDLPNGTYYYTLIIDLSQGKYFRGDVLLVR